MAGVFLRILQNLAFTEQLLTEHLWATGSRSGRPEMSYKTCILRNFRKKVTGKHMCRGLFHNKVTGIKPVTL